MGREYYTRDFTLSSILISLGIPRRQPDPITCIAEIVNGRRREEYTFWFDISRQEDRDECNELVDAYYRVKEDWTFALDEEHPIYYMYGFAKNWERQRDEMKNKVAPQRIVRRGSQTLLIGEDASEELKEKFRQIRA